jgi:hypothetical protein
MENAVYICYEVNSSNDVKDICPHLIWEPTESNNYNLPIAAALNMAVCVIITIH